ncbi:MAG: hypothetical protein ACRDRZ_16465 [Pseudonocardiaceae bacterium]
MALLAVVAAGRTQGSHQHLPLGLAGSEPCVPAAHMPGPYFYILIRGQLYLTVRDDAPTGGATRMRPAEDFNQLSAEQQLNVALETINAFSGWVMNVDTKIAMLSATQVVLALFMAAQRLSRAWPDSPLSKTVLVTLVIFVTSFLATVRHLGAALQPRLSTGPDLNHFVFPSVARVSAGALGKESTAVLDANSW